MRPVGRAPDGLDATRALGDFLLGPRLLGRVLVVRVEVGAAAVEPVLEVGVLAPALVAHGGIEPVLLGGRRRVLHRLTAAAREGVDRRLEGCVEGPRKKAAWVSAWGFRDSRERPDGRTMGQRKPLIALVVLVFEVLDKVPPWGRTHDRISLGFGPSRGRGCSCNAPLDKVLLKVDNDRALQRHAGVVPRHPRDLLLSRADFVSRRFLAFPLKGRRTVVVSTALAVYLSTA
jgi:hypothetical protein